MLLRDQTAHGHALILPFITPSCLHTFHFTVTPTRGSCSQPHLLMHQAPTKQDLCGEVSSLCLLEGRSTPLLPVYLYTLKKFPFIQFPYSPCIVVIFLVIY